MDKKKLDAVEALNWDYLVEIGEIVEDRASDPEWRASFAALRKSLRSKRGSGRRVGAITEDDKYGDDPA